jgi:hypothetical protein
MEMEMEMEMEIEIEFCIRDKSITYTYKKVDPKVSLVLSGHKVSEPCGEVTFPLNMEKQWRGQVLYFACSLLILQSAPSKRTGVTANK